MTEQYIPLTDAEYRTLIDKIEKQFPVRIQLASLAGRPKINVKNYKQLMDFNASMADLFLEISIKQSQNVADALQLIQGVL